MKDGLKRMCTVRWSLLDLLKKKRRKRKIIKIVRKCRTLGDWGWICLFKAKEWPDIVEWLSS